MSHHTGEPRFTDKQVREVLARVAERQTSLGADDDAGIGLRQLEQAAAELGLDPALVRQEAQAVAARPSPGRSSTLLGGPWSVDSDRIVPGRVTAENWPGIVEDIRAKTGRVGVAKQAGALFEWTSEHPDGIHLSFSPSGDGTRVRLTARFGNAPILAYALSVMFGLLGAVMALVALSKSGVPALPGVLIGLGLPLSAFLAARFGFAPFAKKRNRQMAGLAAFLEERLEREVAVEATPARSLEERLDQSHLRQT